MTVLPRSVRPCTSVCGQSVVRTRARWRPTCVLTWFLLRVTAKCFVFRCPLSGPRVMGHLRAADVCSVRRSQYFFCFSKIAPPRLATFPLLQQQHRITLRKKLLRKNACTKKSSIRFNEDVKHIFQHHQINRAQRYGGLPFSQASPCKSQRLNCLKLVRLLAGLAVLLAGYYRQICGVRACPCVGWSGF